MIRHISTLACTAAALLAGSAGAAEMTDGTLTIAAETPEQVRVGDEFKYDIVVTNSSDNLTLRNIVLVQEPGDSVTIEKAMTMKNNGQSAEQQQNNNQNNQNNQNDNQNSQAGEEIRISRLDPGQSKTVAVTAAAERQGNGNICLVVKGYDKALCLGLTATKPELSLTKKAPEEINLCEPFEYTYTLTNDGTGDIGELTVSDKLPEGIMAIDGSDSLSFDVDGLAAGDSRTFKANVVATETGEFSTRAMAKASDELKSRSDAPSTRVIAPKLAVSIDGPSEVYIDTQAKYTIRVSNTGDAVARDTRVDLRFPNAAGFARMGDIREVDQTVNAENAGDRDSVAMVQPTLSEERAERTARNAGGMLPLDDEEGFDFGDLAPGETREVVVSMAPQEQGTYRQVAEVSYYCAAAEELDMRARLTAEVSNATEVIALPALLLAVYDNEEENRGDGVITYRIVVKNQGDAKDTNLQLTATLPEGLKFTSGDGPTDVTGDGQNLKLGKVNTIRPGQVLEWEVQTEVQKGAGDVRFEVEMNADSLNKPATAEEPTRLLDIAAKN